MSTAATPGLLPRPRRGWAWIALGAYVTAVALVLLAPVSPEAIVAGITGWLRDDAGFPSVRQGWVEVAANIALFAPVGALLTLAVRNAGLGVLSAVAFSAGAEMVQLLLPERTASLRDVMANALGAALGAAVGLGVRAIARRRHRAATRPRDDAASTRS